MATKITERMLLDNYDGITRGGSYISVIHNKRVYWIYRTGQDEQGYNVHCARDHASEITLEYDRVGTVEIDDDCDDHPSLRRIAEDERTLWGDMI